jgi:hypothetical protein
LLGVSSIQFFPRRDGCSFAHPPLKFSPKRCHLHHPTASRDIRDFPVSCGVQCRVIFSLHVALRGVWTMGQLLILEHFEPEKESYYQIDSP